jgi:ABC-type branched-subunit amino acid transport system substrate-binding protein
MGLPVFQRAGAIHAVTLREIANLILGRASSDWRRALALLGTAQLSVTAVGCTEAARDNGPSIGVILDYTGTDVSGFNEEQALLLTARLMDQARQGEPPLRFVYRDARGNPADARRAATELVQEGVDVVIGPSSDRTVSEVREVLDAAGIVLVSPNATIGGSATAEQPWFRMSPGNLTGSTTPALIGEHMAVEFVNRGARRALIASDDDVYDVELVRGFKDELLRRGGQVVEESVAGGTPAQQAITAFDQDQVDAVIVAMDMLPAARLIGDVYSAASTVPSWLLTPRLKSDVLLLNTPLGALEHAFGVSLRLPARVSGCEDVSPDQCFSSAMRGAWGVDAFESAYFMYDAAAVVLIAADKVWRESGAMNPAQLREAIVTTAGRGGVRVDWNDFASAIKTARAGGNVQYSGVTGAIVFTASGARVGGETLVFEVQDHEFVDAAN